LPRSRCSGDAAQTRVGTHFPPTDRGAHVADEVGKDVITISVVGDVPVVTRPRSAESPASVGCRRPMARPGDRDHRLSGLAVA
jgi:hypothetical protein